MYLLKVAMLPFRETIWSRIYSLKSSFSSLCLQNQEVPLGCFFCLWCNKLCWTFFFFLWNPDNNMSYLAFYHTTSSTCYGWMYADQCWKVTKFIHSSLFFLNSISCYFIIILLFISIPLIKGGKYCITLCDSFRRFRLIIGNIIIK